jgi:predicted TIM-barrel fold metal-dependent hydrolase
MDLALQQTLKLPISATTMKKYLYDNAAKLLKL